MTFINDQERVPFKFTPIGRLVEFARLVYVVTVNKTRAGSANALAALLKRILLMVVVIAGFFALMQVTGLRGMTGRTQFILFIAVGVFVFFVHVGAIRSSMGAGDANNPMTLHAPVTPLLEIFGTALSQLYINVLTISIIALIIHIFVSPIAIDDPKALAAAFFWAWLCGLAIGTTIAGIGSFIPLFKSLAPRLVMRVNMIFGGKMIAANQLPSALLPFFLWNPLFHIIDHARAATFNNYTVRVTNMEYAMWVTFTFFALGLMLMHASKKIVNPSWAARR
ncbi:MAG: hypothetical protein AAGJ34_01855 [Pseudomonadota bacterium]